MRYGRLGWVILFGVMACTREVDSGADPLGRKIAELQGENYVNLHDYDGPLMHRGKLSWQALAMVETLPGKDGKNTFRFRPDVAALHGQQVKLRGYMIPVEAGLKQARFLLSPDPQGCPYCRPGGPVLLMEVRTQQPIEHDYNAVVLDGILEVMPDDPYGLLYRLVQARRLN